MLRSHWEMVGESADWSFKTGVEAMLKPCVTDTEMLNCIVMLEGAAI